MTKMLTDTASPLFYRGLLYLVKNGGLLATIDPETGEVRHVTSGAAPSGAAPEATSGGGSASDEKVAELTADLQRVQADYANYRKRALRDQEATAERAKAAVVNQLLGVLDDLERARSHGDLDSGPLKSVADKLVGALTGLGLTGFGAEGDDFDPALHEAVQHEGDGGEGQCEAGSQVGVHVPPGGRARRCPPSHGWRTV